MREAITLSGSARQPAYAPGVLWVLGLLAVALALLNPLACMIHCLPRPVSTAAAPAGYAAICHIPSPGAVEAPASAAELTRAPSQTPQAAFAFVAPLPLLLLIGMRRVPAAATSPTTSAQASVRPLSPPPR